MSEQTTTKPRPQVATWAPSQTGPCARCHNTSTCRYGVGGNPPLCGLQAGPAGAVRPPLTVIEPSLSAPITLVLPDGQAIERVRLYEREQLDSGLWMYRIGVPLWQTAVGGGVEPAEYSTWVTAAQLRPLPGVDLGGIPAHPRTRTSAPTRWAWLLDGRTHGRPTVHAEGCDGAVFTLIRLLTCMFATLRSVGPQVGSEGGTEVPPQGVHFGLPTSAGLARVQRGPGGAGGRGPSAGWQWIVAIIVSPSRCIRAADPGQGVSGRGRHEWEAVGGRAVAWSGLLGMVRPMVVLPPPPASTSRDAISGRPRAPVQGRTGLRSGNRQPARSGTAFTLERVEQVSAIWMRGRSAWIQLLPGALRRGSESSVGTSEVCSISGRMIGRSSAPASVVWPRLCLATVPAAPARRSASWMAGWSWELPRTMCRMRTGRSSEERVGPAPVRRTSTILSIRVSVSSRCSSAMMLTGPSRSPHTLARVATAVSRSSRWGALCAPVPLCPCGAPRRVRASRGGVQVPR